MQWTNLEEGEGFMNLSMATKAQINAEYRINPRIMLLSPFHSSHSSDHHFYKQGSSTLKPIACSDTATS